MIALMTRRLTQPAELSDAHLGTNTIQLARRQGTVPFS
jgi:hypothetical protein